MTNYMGAHKDRQNTIRNLLLAAIGTIIFFSMVSCKKSTDAIEATKKVMKFYKVVDIDLDGKEYPSMIVGGKVQVTTINGGKYYTGSEPTSFNNDLDRINWCKLLESLYDYFPGWYCKYCKETAICSATPCNFLSISLKDNVLTWETANEAGINYFSVQESIDGKTFVEAGKVAPKGDGLYSFTIK